MILSQKIDFNKNPITISEVLKELIYNKRLNLSYSPDSMNLNDLIKLPSNEMIVKDVLSLIGEKTNSKIVILDKQVIIKKDRQLTLNYSQKVTNSNNLEKREIEVRKTDSVFERVFPLVCTSISKRPNYKDSILKSYTTRFLTKSDTQISYSLENVVQSTSPKKTPNSNVNSMKPSVYLGGGGNLNFFSIEGDPGMQINSYPTIGYHLQTELNWEIISKFRVELGFLFKKQSISINNSFVQTKIGNLDSISDYGDNSNVNLSDSITSEKVKVRLFTIEVPVLVNYLLRIDKNILSIGIGTYIQMNALGKYQYVSNLNNIDDDITFGTPPPEANNTFDGLRFINKFSYGISGRLGYQYKKLKINFEASYVINNLSPSFTSNETQYSITFLYQILAKK